MDFLLCNDDGIHADGLRVLRDAVRDLGEWMIAAPSQEQSAVGHAITVFDPIKVQRIEEDGECYGHAVGGTPADCVKLAVCELLDTPPRFVLSGINLGSNTGVSVIYSGTVSAATEGAILGIPGIAFSMTTYRNPNWDTAREAVRHVLKAAMEQQFPENCLLNVNIPNLPPEEILGYRITRMADSRWIEKFHRRSDPRGNLYFWLDGEMSLLENADNSDVAAIEAGYVSVTPIGLDLTRYDLMDSLKGWAL